MLKGTLPCPQRETAQDVVANVDQTIPYPHYEKGWVDDWTRAKQRARDKEKHIAAQRRAEKVLVALFYLKQHYPVFREVKPLAIGTSNLVLRSYRQLLNKPFPITYLQQAIQSWVSSLEYHQACLEQTHRYDLQAQPVEALTVKDRQYARSRINKIQTKRRMTNRSLVEKVY
ncbi:ProQ/FinO family protein [Vibrio mediterranei]|uniref:ProQ/FINO family protein n=2 Tax=Vibrio mediterranei TaxID=689 RepID=UPI001EFDA269|nr:ProQ/FINO family protein [Vibrio mediterranei]MCG9629086.1 ProQ/FinO family protein [Vibrio mediterranei]